MLKKHKIILVLISIIFIISIFYINIEKVDLIFLSKRIIALYTEDPIDIETGIINNSYFGISSDGENAKSTTNGINKAIEYASKNNIEFIKLEKGTYLIEGTYKKQKDENTGIILKSNITLDFNSSIIKQIDNDFEHYATLSLYGIENVKILNGILIGDRENHDYSSEKSHQWGMGIRLNGVNNIEIENFEIKNMTGDGIYVTRLDEDTTSNVKIKNCNIHNCRRQGISVICAKNIEIYNNEIHDIGGTNPQAGIDLETNYDNELVENIKIYENIFYNLGANYAIQCYKNVGNVEIFQNQIINGRIRINDAKSEIKIYNNNLKDGEIMSYLTQTNIDNGHSIKKISIYDNILERYNISIKRTNNVIIENNNITDGSVTIISSNAKVYDNNLIATGTMHFAYYFTIYNDDESEYVIYADFKEPKGNFEKIKLVRETEKLIIRT